MVGKQAKKEENLLLPAASGFWAYVCGFCRRSKQGGGNVAGHNFSFVCILAKSFGIKEFSS